MSDECREVLGTDLADSKPSGVMACASAERATMHVKKGGSMAERRQADDMARAAQRMADAAERMAEAVGQLRGASVAEAEPLTEEEADLLALTAVHRAREEMGRVTEGPPPSREEVEG